MSNEDHVMKTPMTERVWNNWRNCNCATKKWLHITDNFTLLYFYMVQHSLCFQRFSV